MKKDVHFLGWGGLQIQIGSLFAEGHEKMPVILDWQPGDIRNCSYTPSHGWIGITAEDRTHGRQALALYDRQKKTTRFLVRDTFVLRHSLNRTGTAISYTQPSSRTGSADLFLYDLENDKSHRLGEAVASHGSTPVWFSDDTRLAYHSPQGRIEVMHVAEGVVETLVEGSGPAVHPDGKSLAFHRGDQLLIYNLLDRTTKSIQLRRKWLEYGLTNGLSWSPDGYYLSFGFTAGVVGKETDFYLLDHVNQQQQRVPIR